MIPPVSSVTGPHVGDRRRDRPTSGPVPRPVDHDDSPARADAPAPRRAAGRLVDVRA